MTLTATLLIATAFLATPEQETKPAGVPITIAVLREDYPWPQSTDSHKVHILMPVAAWQDGNWVSERLYSMKISDERLAPESKEFRPEQKVFLDSLIDQTFYLSKGSSGTFMPRKKTVTHMCDDGFLGMDGLLRGKFNKTDLLEGVAMANSQRVFGSMRPGTLTAEDKHLLAELIPKHMNALVKETESERPPNKKSPAFNSANYQTPEYVQAIRCSLPGGWEGLWVHAKISYPSKMSPPPVDTSIDDSLWSGYHYALLDPSITSRDRVLWEYASMPGYSWQDTTYQLMGVFDANADGRPELLFFEGGYESGAYQLKQLQEEGLVDISAVSGGL
jgi:hypothetical protein